MYTMFWRALVGGQIVTSYAPQLRDSAEGEEGPAIGLRLVVDGSDRSWDLSDLSDSAIIASGRGDMPTVTAAMAIRESRLEREWRAHIERTEGSFMWSGRRPPTWRPGLPSPWVTRRQP